MKVYLVCQVWPNTKNNHTGMLYLCDQLALCNSDIVTISLPYMHFRGARILYYLLYRLVAVYLSCVVRKGDCVILMEYLGSKSRDQSIIASYLRRLKCQPRIFALVHIGHELLEQQFSKQEILDRASMIDMVWVLGSSLKSFLCSLGIPDDKIRVTFHYVDTKYYLPETERKQNKRLRVVVMGNMQRDYDLLYEVVSKMQHINFDLCIGISNELEAFKEIENVTYYSYVMEDHLKKIMNEADVSLNIMKDTIGSNVIVTSMAMGLAMVVSDVGSIRNYVDESNGIFCETLADYMEALNYLNNNRALVEEMKMKSRLKAQEFEFDRFYDWFLKVVYETQ